MDGIMMDTLAKTFDFDRTMKPEWSFLGKVDSINADGTINVISGYSYNEQTQTATPTLTECLPFFEARVGDVAYVHVFEGKAVAISPKYKGHSSLYAKNALYVEGNTSTAQPYGAGYILFNSANRNGYVMRMYGSSDSNGDALLIGDGALTILGAGESSSNLYDALVTNGDWTNGTERLILGSDNQVHLYANANTVANRVEYVFSWNSSTVTSPWAAWNCGGNHVVSIDTSTTNGTTSQTAIGDLYMRDKNGTWASRFGSRTGNSGQIVTQIGAHNILTDGTTADNYFIVQVEKDGSQTYWVSNKPNFRTAILAAEKPTSLYNSTTGTTGTVTLSQSAANFTKLRLYLRKNNDQNQVNSVDVYSPNGKYVLLNNGYVGTDGTNQWVTLKTVLISGTSITNYGYGNSQVGVSSPSTNNENRIAIYRVEGWND